ERAVFFGDAWNVGSCIVDPDIFGWIAFGEENHVGFSARAVRTKGAVWQAEDGVQFAVFGKNFKNIAGLIGEEAVIRNHNSGATARFENRHNMLDKVELLVAG